MVVYKVRVGFDSELHDFDKLDDAFEWVRSSNPGRCTVQVLTFERDTLEDLTRWFYDGRSYFKREDIRP